MSKDKPFNMVDFAADVVMGCPKQARVMEQLREDWHDERIVACVKACEGIESLSVVRAAPDLLEACKVALTRFTQGASCSLYTYQHIAERLEAAIAKAERGGE